MHKLDLIRQVEASECGLACVAMIANFHGHKLDIISLRQRFGVSLAGATIRSLVEMSNELSLSSRALRIEPDVLGEAYLPCIAHWDMDHYVVISDVRRNRIRVFDPIKGDHWISPSELSRHFTGIVLELVPTSDFKPIEAIVKPRLRDLLGRLIGVKRALIQSLTLSLILQAAVLAAPFYIQIAIDEVVPSFDRDFMIVLALAFGALGVVRAFTEWLRAWIILNLGNSLIFQITGNIFSHLIRLPADYFEKRHVGDIITRLDSTAPIQRALTEGLVAALIDGVMAITTAAIMVVYDWRLALISFAFVATYVAISVGTVSLRHRLQEAEITEQAIERSNLIETIHAARTIKQFAKEPVRESTWRNMYASVLRKSLKLGRLNLVVSFSQTLLWNLQLVVIIYFATIFVLDGEFTVGAIFAFVAYRQSFVNRVQDLIRNAIEFRMLGLHLERLADIVYTKQETGVNNNCGEETTASIGIELRSASFRYSRGTSYIYRDLNLEIAPGSFVAITGPSGGGKSTLLKTLLGQLRPEEGEYLVNNVTLDNFGLRPWRKMVGAVMQDDRLLSGTLADNISFFDPDIDMEKVQKAADSADIHEEIMKMPMKYMTLVGDMGSALSGGQIQRVLLARALYPDPLALFLDEGTANLDVQSEIRIAETIGRMHITRVAVAHRPELLRRADRLLVMNEGILTEAATDFLDY